MSILYLEDHIPCNHYEQNGTLIIEELQFKKGIQIELLSNNNQILFMVSGSLKFCFDKSQEKTILEKEMILLPSGQQFTTIIENDGNAIIIKLPQNTQLWDCISIERMIIESEINVDHGLKKLKINEMLWNFLDTLKYYLAEGRVFSFHFFELKLKELFFIMQSFYSKEVLANFFYPIISNDINFSHFIYANYDKVKTAQELATLSNYSFSGFQKRFKRVFKVSVYHWMLLKKAQKILQDINLGIKPLKEISEEYGFNSPAHFNDFCKIHFGCTPGKMRKKIVKGESIVNDFGHNI